MLSGTFQVHEETVHESRKGTVLSANQCGKNFAGLEDIKADDASMMIVRNERVETSSQGRWSSDVVNTSKDDW